MKFDLLRLSTRIASLIKPPPLVLQELQKEATNFLGDYVIAQMAEAGTSKKDIDKFVSKFHGTKDEYGDGMGWDG